MNPISEEALFARALEKAPAERAAFLDRECAGDAAGRQRLENLLLAHDAGRGFLEVHSTDKSSTPFPDSLMREALGTLVGRYKLLEKLGEGGFGAVYVAEQREPVRRRVALKIIKLGMDTKQVVARFEAERQALALMDHPNIAKVLDAGATDTGRPYFVMELVKGIPITQYCEQEKLETKERLDLFIKICHAIQHAHQKGIIHRDIKPSNILVTLHDGVPVPKVIDFGIAKATQGELTDKTIYTQFQQFIGTPAYMSPEQAEMSGLDIDTRSDIYSLGVLLYELLTGSTPFDTKELMRSGLDEMRKIIREREPVRPSTRLTQLPGSPSSMPRVPRSAIEADLDWIVMKCLEKDRTRRYETANGLAVDLRRHLTNEPVTARPPSAAYRFQKTLRRHKLECAAGAAVAAALIGGTVLTSLQAVRARRAEAEQSHLRQLAEASETQALQAQANESALRQLAEQATARLRESVYASDMRVAHHGLEEGNLGRVVEILANHVPASGESDLRGFEWRYLWGQSRGDEVLKWRAHDDAVTCIAFTPDGKGLVSSGFDRVVKVWNSDQGAFRSWILGGQSARWCLGFSDNGDLLAVALDNELVLLKSGTWEMFAKLGSVSKNNDSGAVLFLREDQQVAASVTDGVGVWSIQSKERQLIRGQGPGFGALLAYSGRAHRLAIGDEKTIWFWDAETGVLEELKEGNETMLVGLVSNRTGDQFAAGRKDGSVELIAATTSRVIKAWKAHASLAYGLAFSPDGTLLATGGADQLIHLWDLAALQQSSSMPQPLRTLRGHQDQVWALAFSPDGSRLASSSKVGFVALWETRGKPTIETSAESSIEFESLNPDSSYGFLTSEDVYSFDGKLLARAQNSPSGPKVQLRDAASDRLLFQMSGHRRSLGSMVFSPSDRHLATGGHDNLIRVWLTATGEERLILRGHFTAVTALAFSPNERTLASGSTDGTVKLWSVVTGQDMISRTFSHGTVADLKFSTDGRVLGVQFADASASVEYFRAPSWLEIQSEQVASRRPQNFQ